MPSNEQVIINLRSVLSADILNPDNPELSDSGRLLVKFTKQWLHQFIDLLQHKNSQDQIQDFVWYLTKARISVDVQDIARRTTRSKAKADATAGKLTSGSYGLELTLHKRTRVSKLLGRCSLPIPTSVSSSRTSTRSAAKSSETVPLRYRTWQRRQESELNLRRLSRRR
jgi:hypothetical protein